MEREEYELKTIGLFADCLQYNYHYTSANGMDFSTVADSLEKCRALRDDWLKQHTVSFTGHRHLGLSEAMIREVTYKQIERLYQDGYRFFLIGGAVGFDMIAAETCLDFKATHTDIMVNIVAPYIQQNQFYSKRNKVRYNNILSYADDIIYMSEEYYKECFLKRNDYMIKHSQVLIAYYDGYSIGGTSYTIRKAKSKKMQIINLYRK